MILTLPLFTIFSGVMSGIFLGACVPNLKFVSLAILELLPFNDQTFTGSQMTPATSPFTPFLHSGVSGHQRTKFEL